MKKKSQVSLYVILGLTLLIALIAGFFVYNNIRTTKIKEEAKKLADLELRAKAIEKFINECIRKAGFEGLKSLGETGGYVKLPKLDVPKLINFQGTGMWQIEQANIQPFLNQTQERLIAYINASLPKCIENENISKLGFLIEKTKPNIFIEFANNDAVVKVIYPIKLTKEKFTKQFSEFFNIFEIRYRAIFEAATEINERLFDADFDIREPLKKLDYLKTLNFDVDYQIPETDIIKFIVTDKSSKTETDKLYAFSFIAKLGESTLKRVTDLQNCSATNPTFLTFTIYSVDKKAQLDISEGTTISLNGQCVKAIIVQQSYPNEVVTKDVPVYKKNGKVLKKQDIKYVIDNPVYTFEPSGILFNKFEKLTLYYNDTDKDDKGVGILMGKNGFWVPIPSIHEPEYKRVFTNILGFTEFTAVNCASQQVKKTIAEHFFEPSPPCFVFLALKIITIALTIYLGFGVFSVVLNGAWATVLGATYIALVAISITGTILNGSVGVFYDGSPDNCETFYPTCDQNILIDKDETDGSGECTPDNNVRAAAGQPINVCAQIEKCDFLSTFLCMPCSVKCTASFT